MKITRKKFIRNGIFLLTSILLLDAFWLEKYCIETKEFFLGKATKESNNISMVQVSDLHINKLNAQLKQLATTINKKQPDFILFTGDAIDQAKSLPLLESFLSLLDKTLQKIAITGNWEYWGNVNIQQLKQVYAKYNGLLLINESVQFTINKKTISFTGVDDLLGGTPDFMTAVAGYKESDHHIILNHCPAYNDEITKLMTTKTPADFILSGHTHGGQINLFGYIPFRPQGSGTYLKGWYETTNPRSYVSRGIGTSILPARFLARSEVAIFNLC